MKIIIWRTILVVLLGIILVGYVKINLKSNAVYYAKNMPRGEGQEPELIMLIDNLWWVDNPDIEDLKYDIDGTNAIIDSNNEARFTNLYYDDTEYKYGSADDITYIFNKRMELIYIKDYKKKLS